MDVFINTELWYFCRILGLGDLGLGGLGISVIFVGALLAATTGIVGATVIAMGLISLPTMLNNKYDRSLASGIVCSSGTLGQIIPPSIVLIIIADQLEESNASNPLRSTSFEMALFGTGVMKGPFAVDKAYPNWNEEGEVNSKSLQEILHYMSLPYYYVIF